MGHGEQSVVKVWKSVKGRELKWMWQEHQQMFWIPLPLAPEIVQISLVTPAADPSGDAKI